MREAGGDVGGVSAEQEEDDEGSSVEGRKMEQKQRVEIWEIKMLLKKKMTKGMKMWKRKREKMRILKV